MLTRFLSWVTALSLNVELTTTSYFEGVPTTDLYKPRSSVKRMVLALVKSIGKPNKCPVAGSNIWRAAVELIGRVGAPLCVCYASPKPLSFPLTPISLSLASRSFVSLLLGVDRY